MNNMTNDAAHAASALEYNRRQCSFGARPLSNGTLAITENMTAHSIIEILEQMARRIFLRGEMPSIQFNDAGVYLLTPLGIDLRRLNNMIDDDFFKNSKRHAFNPYITVMMSALERWKDELDGSWMQASSPLMGIHPVAKATLDRVVRFVRRVTQSKRFRRILHNHDRLGIKDMQSGCSFLANCFARYSRLLIVRVDLYYANDEDDLHCTAKADKAHWKLLRALSDKRIIPGGVGWLSRREKGFDRGMHYHIFVVMNGHEYKDGFTYAAKIGEYWQALCNKEKYAGSYFNCFTRTGRDSPFFDGLGLVDISDTHKLIGSREAIRYITKGYYKVRPDGGVTKNFRRSLAPRSGTKRGAPRRPEHNMSLVIKILGAG